MAHWAFLKARFYTLTSPNQLATLLSWHVCASAYAQAQAIPHVKKCYATTHVE